MRRRTDTIVIHCSATRPAQDIGADEIREWHMSAPNNWRDIGYAAVIRRNGTIEFGRHFDDVGAHVYGFNTRSVGVCLVGGLDENGEPACNFTDAQKDALGPLVLVLRMAYPTAQVLGHRDLSPDLDGDGIVERQEWLKACPCFDVRHWIHTGEWVFEYTEANDEGSTNGQTENRPET